MSSLELHIVLAKGGCKPGDRLEQEDVSTTAVSRPSNPRSPQSSPMLLVYGSDTCLPQWNDVSNDPCSHSIQKLSSHDRLATDFSSECLPDYSPSVDAYCRDRASDTMDELLDMLDWPETETKPSLGATTKHRQLVEDITLLLDNVLRSAITLAPGRLSRNVKLSYSTEPLYLATIAPSIFLPGYIEAVAAQVPFLSRIAVSLQNIRERGICADNMLGESCGSASRGSLEPSLWSQLDTEMQSRFARKKLKPLQAHMDCLTDMSLELIDEGQLSRYAREEEGISDDMLEIGWDHISEATSLLDEEHTGD